MNRLTATLALLVWMIGSSTFASETYKVDDAQRQRYHDLSLVLRCPKCQNQNIAESTSPIAEDLRFEIHRMLNAGQSDEQIIEFMVERYGEFVLYYPKFSPKTILLYVGPVAMMLLGVLAVAVIVSTRRRVWLKKESLLSHDERHRLIKLLHDADQSIEKKQ